MPDGDSGTAADNITAFRALILAHPFLVQAKVELEIAIREAKPGELIVFVGPTGTGKTVVRQRLQDELTMAMVRELRTDTRRVAAAVVEAVMDSGEFSWIEHWKRTLLSLDLPSLPAMLPHRSFSAPVFSHAYLRLLDAVEEALRHRQPRVLFIEQAHHLFHEARNDTGRSAAYIVSDLAKTTRVPHVLVGAYDMLRRIPQDLPIRLIELRRYRWNDTYEGQFFRSILTDLSVWLPGEVGRDLGSWAEYLYERSVGCIGTLHNWLLRALMLRLDSGPGPIAFEQLQATAPRPAESAMIAADAISGERLVVEMRIWLHPVAPLEYLAAAS